jgi:succinate dehydrogenase/fumarate reductase flavoprotein subunit
VAEFVRKKRERSRHAAVDSIRDEAKVLPDTHATDIAGLYAAGVITRGVHGANRQGGNSLVETLVFGRRAGEAAAAYSQEIPAPLRDPQTISGARQRRSRAEPHQRSHVFCRRTTVL